jgi:preprotein translocase subunit SecA
MAQRDPLVEYQREGFALFQSMMGQIREETVGFLFNLDVQVNTPAGEVDAPVVQAKGLEDSTATEKLSYSAPSDSGGVEVRNEKGQIEQAATARAAKKAEEESAPVASAFSRGASTPAATPASGQQGAKRPASGPQAKRPSNAPAANNRADRRKQGKKK